MVPVPARTYDDAAAILKHLGVRSGVLLTNNPAKVAGLEAGGITVDHPSPLIIAATPASHSYLETKRRLMGHLLPLAFSGNRDADDRSNSRTVS
jgi:3,4-dihydroxy 2-butanone 4-phosphate synthase/GTP cyclohydrolase II